MSCSSMCTVSTTLRSSWVPKKEESSCSGGGEPRCKTSGSWVAALERSRGSSPSSAPGSRVVL
eukprot:CAMPEP_0202894554 /NCGR_PEP_ID=MMETSP1392-20130828/3937_1 /ASSEMBLY_ACC=CAM_ASM_000868 /TAXON_ID=225041 /ORGANISM="Chlamydomonas chlamydogama, Strain SAG 11-48b" /LENGTH=62 /DNA_ID=CAMNT_0049579283 /DNA_START=318 /DNA_END=506 /DNA_ORIENTATION=-